MKIDILNVNYIIDGKVSVIPTKIFYKQIDEELFQNIRYEVVVNNHLIQSKVSESMEIAVKQLQKELPDNISLACCQSCRHGHFNPFGDQENEIFCLKDKTFHNRDEVVELFSKQDKSLASRTRKLLYYCKSYKSICENEMYTYNDWGLGE